MEGEPRKKEEISLEKTSHELSEMTAEQRKAIFEHLTIVKNEKWASEALETGQHFSVEEQELLVSMISDPQISSEVLTIDHINGDKLTKSQAEKLMEQMLSDEEVAYSVYINLMESGIEPDEMEKWWIEKIEKVLSQTETHEIGSYLLEHSNSLNEEDRERLSTLV